MPVGLDYSFRWNNYRHPDLVAAYDMFTRTPGGLMKNLAYTGSTYDGTINGTYTSASPIIRGKRTPSMDFDGANNYISFPSPLALGAMTVSMWVQFYPTGVSFNYFSTIGIASVVGLSSISGRFLYHSGVPYKYWLDAVQWGLGNRHIAFVIPSGDLAGVQAAQLYINGKIQRVISNSYAGAPSAWNTFVIGTGGYGFCPFTLDNIQIFNIALTQPQVNSIYRSGVPR